MTPEEHANKIPLWVMYDIPGRKEWTYKEIASEIRQAVKEAYEHAASIAELHDHKDFNQECCGAEYQIGRKIRSKAKEL